MGIMRTTLAIDDVLLKIAKRRAAEQQLTLGQLVEEALRHELARDASRGPRPEVPVFRGTGGLRPGVDITSNRAFVEVLDEGVPFEQLR